MLNLDRHIKLDEKALKAPNLTSAFEDRDLQAIGNWVWEGYEKDRQSRSKWEQRMSTAMNLALQIMEAKNFPWPNCANVAFPLVTIGALQFHARAYPTIVSGTDVVKCRVIGEDPDGSQKARADRISTHMSWQLLEQDQAWEAQQDALLINLPIVGCAFKKSYWSGALGHNVSELVLAKDLVLDYFAKSVESCGRKTHTIPLSRNYLHEQIFRETFRNVREESWYRGLPPIQPLTGGEQRNQTDRRSGVQKPSTPDETTPFCGLEQHVSLDLDGDGYAEPYIITLEESSKCVLRIVTRVDREEDIERTKSDKIIRVNPVEYFTKYTFIPSPEASIYDIGFGMFLGPLNEAVNSLVNIMLDSGTMSMGSPILMGRGAKIRGGVYSFAPFEMKRVDSTGDDLRKNLYQMEIREPSAVLFQLLSLLINYTQRVAGTTDIMVGENIGQNTPKGTADTLVNEGSKIYNSIFKRIWRGMKEEVKKLYILNAVHLPTSGSFGQKRQFLREDYLGDPNTVAPAADPNVTSEQMDIQRATAIAQRSQMVPGYDKDQVEMRLLKAMKVDAPQEVFKGSQSTPPPEDPKVTIAKMKLQASQMELQADAAEADKARQQESMMFYMEMQEDHLLNQAKIADLMSKAQATMMDQQGDAADRQVALLQSQLKYLESKDKQLQSRMQIMLGHMEMVKKEHDVRMTAAKGAIDLHVAREKGAIAIDTARKKGEQSLEAAK